MEAAGAILLVFSYLFLIALALVCFAIAFYFLVRRGRFPSLIQLILAAPFVLAGLGILGSLIPQGKLFELPGVLVDPLREPRLMAEVGSVAAALNLALPAEVRLIIDGNAGVAQDGGFMGFGSRRILLLGMPLIAALSVSELRAILAHEFAHFYSGDTRLSPWLWNTVKSMVQVHQNLERQASILSKRPFLSVPNTILYKPLLYALEQYWVGFLGLMLWILRPREFRADEIACHLAGSDEFAEALREFHKASAISLRYWHTVVLPLVHVGYQPRLTADFFAYRAAPIYEQAASAFLEKQLQMIHPDPSDAHPPLAARLERIRSLALPGPQSNTQAAFFLFDNLSTWETDLLRKAVPELANAKLKPVDWETAATDIYLPEWRKNIEPFQSLIPRKTVSSFPDCLRNLGPIADKVFSPPDQSLSRSDREERAVDILGCALWIALVDDGWKLVIRPGLSYLEREDSDFVLDPDVGVIQLRKGIVSADEWQASCAGWKIGDIPFGQKDLVEQRDPVATTRLYPPDCPRESQYLYSKSAVHHVSIYEAAMRMFECLGQPSYNLKPKVLPQLHRPFVGTDHEVELHRLESALTCMLKRMRAHRTRHAAPRGC